MRLFIRRRDWGDARATVRRARRVFGVPGPLRWLWSFGVRVEPVSGGSVPGEWVVPDGAASGTILYLHGGGYIACSPGHYRPVTAGLARLARRRVFVPDYRLAPEHRFPAALDDAVAAYRWLLDQGISPGTIALAGDSAGGGLVLALLLRVREAGLPFPACAVCFSPWTDLTASGESVTRNDGRCAMFRPENIAAAASLYLDGASPRNPYASPVFADLSGLPPMLIQVGSTELLLDDSRQIHAKVQEAGGASRLEVFEGVSHVWQIFDGLVPESREAMRRAAEFISDPQRR
jgi:epsilon-lactone hydrolase